ncbi:MAG: hypothetical protein K0S32_447 [Bacteroidetes bacterium]|jgi:uncharacterized protein (TIGR02284 family)|nr:hypothetical protein [Bacteroidota bacterium]
MLKSDQRPYEVLNDLITINTERIEGYNFATKEANVAVLKDLFARLTETSLICRQDLVKEVYKLGGVPNEIIPPVNFLDALREIKTAVVFRDHKAILSSCDHEEAVVIRSYEQALNANDENFTTQHHLLFNKHCDLLRADHDKVKNLLDVLVSGV